MLFLVILFFLLIKARRLWPFGENYNNNNNSKLKNYILKVNKSVILNHVEKIGDDGEFY